MSGPIRLLWILLAIVAALPLQAATLSAELDRDRIASDETLTLTLRYEGDADASPDISALEPFFDVVGRARSQQISIINGRRSSAVEWRFTLAPKTEGRILIPPFRIADAESRPLEVEVTAPRIDPNLPGDDTFLTRELEPRRAVVGQQLILRVQLHTAVALDEMQITELQADGARIEPLEDRQYQRRINGRTYRVYEKNYALFPERPGKLRIGPQRLTARAGAPRSLFGLGGARRVRLSADELEVDVKQPPKDVDLVANKVTLSRHLEIVAGPLRVGEPVSLRIELQTEGADPARIPALNLGQPDGLRVYPEPASDQQTGDPRGLIVTRSRSFALVPERAGELTIPAMTLRWWNGAEGRVEEARSEAIRLQVMPAADGSGARPERPSASSPAPSEKPPLPAPEPPSMTEARTPAALWWLLLVNNLAWAALALWLWRRGRMPVTARGTAPLPDKRGPGLRQLEQICRSAPPAELRQALLRWARAEGLCGTEGLNGLASASEELRRQIEALDRALYAGRGDPPDRDLLWQEIRKLAERKGKTAAKPEALPPLNP